MSTAETIKQIIKMYRHFLELGLTEEQAETMTIKTLSSFGKR